MIKSMTGYGVAGFENEQLVIQVENVRPVYPKSQTICR